MKRTLNLKSQDKVGKKIKLFGWVDSLRDHGKIVFFDLRDRSGIIQVVGGEKLKKLGLEDVVEVVGLVKKRPEKLVNPDLATGKVELEVKKFAILNKAKELPFPIKTDGLAIEEKLRLKYRYLDLRRPRMAYNIRARSKAVNFIRSWLLARDFCEIETPNLTKTTPEGARDFLVPSRLQPGNFYALPQSPQQYKQLLMVAGVERYFQIARCFRDEDARHDRAYGEFTQLDIEMSFVEQEDILALTENLFAAMIEEVFPKKKMNKSPWPRISYDLAMKKYHSDKPDLRKNKKDKDELAFAWIINFPLFVKQTKEDYFHGSGKAGFAPCHHMFTSPVPEDVPLLDKDPLEAHSLQHDLILNGAEVGGGSIRISDAKIQSKIFDLIGFSAKQKQEFNHLLRAFEYGVPPHGGIAPGIDRLLMAILGEPSLREVIAFPCATSGRTAVMDAPSLAAKEQLAELAIRVVDSNLQKR
ncbi:MAG: amino acid--tRNA ligase-related protein [Candidatus Shapirobacteria bacterium]